ncbi:PAS domain S-box protein [Paenibacillus antri]|uniref:histidine kinase n=1 Tax=Paenibacillus antri TaxID=2582848 RepID=A0A5R9GB19_9BACL|nr:PAS domain S-box protein [Paenibacillus antri]TLS51290.1 PAS domain S-box protein [Paenibacillus antri]
MSLDRKDTALLEHAFMHAPIGKALVGLDGRCMQVNRSLCELLGYSEQELQTYTFHTVTHPDDLDLDERNVQRLLDGHAGSYRIEKRYLTRSGDVVWAILSVSLVRSPEGAPLFFVSQIQDITERKQLEQVHQESERLFRLLAEHSADMIARHSPDNVCLYVSPSCERILGYAPEELIGVSAYEFIHPDDAKSLREESHLPSDGPDERLLVFRTRRKDGAYVWLETSCNVLRDETGAVRETISVLRDVTLQKRYIEENDRLRHHRERIEEDLQRSEDNYRRLVEDFPEAIVLAKGERWMYVNDAAARLLGASKEELLRRNAYDTVHPEFHDRIRLRIEQVEGRREPLESMEEKLVRMDGQIIDVEIVCIPAVYEKIEMRCLLIRNITEQKRTQDLIVHSEKLAVAGQFAAAIAHEIRNPLTAIKGFMQLLMRDMTTDKSRFFDVIFAEMNRIEMITNELLILAKPQLIKFTKKDVRFLMQQVVSFMDAQANMNNVLIQVDYGTGDLVASCDENQLKQVFINFIKNAIEAMPDGGIIKIQMRRSAGNVAEIRFIDQGVGIAEEELAKLGEPFFTTKESGTGLGLMVTKRIVQQHEGDVRFRSKLGEGTTVEMTLPIA